MSYCPECNNSKTIKMYYGHKNTKVIELENSGELKYGGPFAGVNPPPDHYCPKCGFEFNVWELTDNFSEEELEEYYIKHRSRYKPERVKYLIINEAPPTIWKGTTPPFFFNNPNCGKNDLFMEVMTTLFLPDEYIDKTRTTGYTVDLEVEMHKYLKLFKERGFFQVDIVNEPRSFFETRNITPAKLDKKVIKAMEKNLKSKLLLIESLTDSDTIIFLVKKTIYDLFYPLLSGKYRIANDILIEEFGKPYLPAGGGNNKIFRQKFEKCLKSIEYKFETDFSYLRNL